MFDNENQFEDTKLHRSVLTFADIFIPICEKSIKNVKKHERDEMRSLMASKTKRFLNKHRSGPLLAKPLLATTG